MLANVSWQDTVTLGCNMDTCVSAATSLASTARWMMGNVRVCVSGTKREIVDLSGITQSFLQVRLLT